MRLSCKGSRPGRRAQRPVIMVGALALAVALLPSLGGRALAMAASPEGGLAAGGAAAGGAAASGVAPGRPGARAVWTPAGKSGFGTARGTRSKVW
jgi:hypothetical protein